MLAAVVVAVYAAAGGARAADAAPAGSGGSGDPAGILSLRRNAIVSIGGEVATDYTFRRATGRGTARNDRKDADLALRSANLRVQADVHPGVAAFFKIDLSSNPERDTDAAALAEEALLVMKAVGGTGLGFFAGKGKAPYGQDITLGMVKSYAHSANHADSSEGRVFILDPPVAAGSGGTLPPMRPGAFDRAFLAGASYDWDERWRVEVAAFRPDGDDVDRRLAGDGRENAGTGAAARVWWMATPGLALEASAVWARAGDLADVSRRTDATAGAEGRRDAYALSLGFDWRGGPWRAFGEFQLGRDWNFTDGYSVRTWQLGAARQIGPAWRVGAMAEGLRINHGPAGKTVDNYYKLAFNVRYSFQSGVFLLAEYSHEWLRRTGAGGAGRAGGDFLGVRMGWSF